MPSLRALREEQEKQERLRRLQLARSYGSALGVRAARNYRMQKQAQEQYVIQSMKYEIEKKQREVFKTTNINKMGTTPYLKQRGRVMRKEYSSTATTVMGASPHVDTSEQHQRQLKRNQAQQQQHRQQEQIRIATTIPPTQMNYSATTSTQGEGNQKLCRIINKTDNQQIYCKAAALEKEERTKDVIIMYDDDALTTDKNIATGDDGNVDAISTIPKKDIQLQQQNVFIKKALKPTNFIVDAKKSSQNVGFFDSTLALQPTTALQRLQAFEAQTAERSKKTRNSSVDSIGGRPPKLAKRSNSSMQKQMGKKKVDINNSTSFKKVEEEFEKMLLSNADLPEGESNIEECYYYYSETENNTGLMEGQLCASLKRSPIRSLSGICSAASSAGEVVTEITANTNIFESLPTVDDLLDDNDLNGDDGVFVEKVILKMLPFKLQCPSDTGPDIDPAIVQKVEEVSSVITSVTISNEDLPKMMEAQTKGNESEVVISEKNLFLLKDEEEQQQNQCNEFFAHNEIHEMKKELDFNEDGDEAYEGSCSPQTPSPNTAPSTSVSQVRKVAVESRSLIFHPQKFSKASQHVITNTSSSPHATAFHKWRPCSAPSSSSFLKIGDPNRVQLYTHNPPHPPPPLSPFTSSSVSLNFSAPPLTSAPLSSSSSTLEPLQERNAQFLRELALVQRRLERARQLTAHIHLSAAAEPLRCKKRYSSPVSANSNDKEANEKSKDISVGNITLALSEMSTTISALSEESSLSGDLFKGQIGEPARATQYEIDEHFLSASPSNVGSCGGSSSSSPPSSLYSSIHISALSSTANTSQRAIMGGILKRNETDVLGSIDAHGAPDGNSNTNEADEYNTPEKGERRDAVAAVMTAEQLQSALRTLKSRLDAIDFGELDGGDFSSINEESSPISSVESHDNL